MKKHKALLAAAMLLTAAWMTGCDSEQSNSSSDEKTVETTALTVLSEETTAVEESQTDSTAAAESDAQADTQSNLEFDNYDAFLEALGEHYPGVVVVAPPQIVSGEWDVAKIQLLTTGEQPYYDYAVTTPEGQSLVLTVSYDIQFDSIDALKEQCQTGSVEIQEGYSGSNWVIGMMAEPPMYVLYGLTGDESLFYSLIGADAEGNTLTPDDLQSLREAMQL